MRTRILILISITLLVGAGAWLSRSALHEWLFQLTGESETLPQVRGFFQYLSNYTRPAPETDDSPKRQGDKLEQARDAAAGKPGKG